MVPACSSGTLNMVLPHWNNMTYTSDMTPTIFKYKDTGQPVVLSIWNVTLAETTKHFHVLGLTHLRNHSPTFQKATL